VSKNVANQDACLYIACELHGLIILGQDAVTSAIREIYCRGLSAQTLGIMGRLQVSVGGRRRRGPVSRMVRRIAAPVRRLSDAVDHIRISVRLVTLVGCK